MPDLSQIGDVEALENRYLGKVIVYVESEHDEAAYNQIVGPDVADRLEFKTPKQGASGWEVVRDRVRAERPSNDNIYGLMDGDAVVHFAGWEQLIACASRLFSVPGAATEGFIFTNVHELENLLMLYGDICGIIIKDVRMADLGSRTREDVQKTLFETARRFFVAAAIKFALAELERSGTPAPPFKVAKFRDQKLSSTSLLAELQAEVKKANLDWPRVRAEVRAIIARLKDLCIAEGLQGDAQGDQFVRLADGKGLMARLREIFRSGGTWDGHLVDAVTRADYAAEFREELLQLTHAA